jgi:hypothetical protein
MDNQTKEPITDADIQQQVEKRIQRLALLIEEAVEEIYFHKVGFALLTFEFGQPEIGNYISNAERPTMIQALRETANRLETNQDIPISIGKVQ